MLETAGDSIINFALVDIVSIYDIIITGNRCNVLYTFNKNIRLIGAIFDGKFSSNRKKTLQNS